MVCLYGITLDVLEESMKHDPDLHKFKIWNWLGYKFTLFVFKKFGRDKNFKDIILSPFVPQKNSILYVKWSKWFWKVFKNIKNKFDDATPQMVLRCIMNPPSEEITLIIHDSSSLELQKEFYNFLKDSLPIKYTLG